MAWKTATSKKPDSQFAQAVDLLRERLKAKGIDIRDRIVDAEKPLEFFIGHSHIEGAKVRDNDNCVLARAVRDYWPNKRANVWIAHSFTMVLDWDEELVTRFVSPKSLWSALKVFDKTGVWPLAPKKYTLRPPTGTAKLVKNMSKKDRSKAEVRYQKWRITAATRKANGQPAGEKSVHSGRDLTRFITVLPRNRQNPKSGKSKPE
jgi:hypothetical protein